MLRYGLGENQVSRLPLPAFYRDLPGLRTERRCNCIIDKEKRGRREEEERGGERRREKERGQESESCVWEGEKVYMRREYLEWDYLQVIMSST